MCRCSCARTIRPGVIDYREPEIKDCACGQDHVTMPMNSGDREYASRERRNRSCVCGGNPDAIVNAVKMGMQLAAWDTYQPNLAATEEREAAERARQTVARWHE